MNREAVFALPERGLRSDACRSAEPKSCEGQLKQLNERTRDTMKTYLLRDPETVQLQKTSSRAARRTRRASHHHHRHSGESFGESPYAARTFLTFGCSSSPTSPAAKAYQRLPKPVAPQPGDDAANCYAAKKQQRANCERRGKLTPKSNADEQAEHRATAELHPEAPASVFIFVGCHVVERKLAPAVSGRRRRAGWSGNRTSEFPHRTRRKGILAVAGADSLCGVVLILSSSDSATVAMRRWQRQAYWKRIQAKLSNRMGRTPVRLVLVRPAPTRLRLGIVRCRPT